MGVEVGGRGEKCTHTGRKCGRRRKYRRGGQKMCIHRVWRDILTESKEECACIRKKRRQMCVQRESGGGQ